MGMYNTLLLTITCPRCGVEAEMEADFRFGLMELTQYRIGDQLRWDGMGVKTPETRPEDGNYDDEAYVVCPHCERDFWLTVSVRNDVIVGASIDASKQPYIPDEFAQKGKPMNSLEYYDSLQNVRNMEPLIIVRRIPYEEPYHTRLELVVSNGVFGGSTDIYCGVQELKEIGDALQKFPARVGDEYRYVHGSEERENLFYRYFVLRAYTTDALGHCAIQFIINLNKDEPDEGVCRFSISAEAAAVNRLGKLFEQFSELKHLEFRWSRKEAELFEEYQLSDAPSTLISPDRTPQYFPAAPMPSRTTGSRKTTSAWDPVAHAEKMRKSTWDVSAFFLIDSLDAFPKCIQWLTVLEPYNMPDMEHSPYFDQVREIYRSGKNVMNFDHDFKLVWKNKEFPAKLRCHYFERGRYEIELWLPGVIANEVAGTFQDGHEGFWCVFMPPAFYD